MTKRGKKSNVIIAGHRLTFAEIAVLNQLRTCGRSTVDLHEIFPDSRGKRFSARHLAEVGVLAVYGIELLG